MKKTIIAMMLALVLLTACGSAANQTSAGTGTSEAETELTERQNESNDLQAEQVSTSIESEITEEIANSISTKEELLFNTTYTLHDDWTVKKIDYDTSYHYQILLQNEDPDTVTNSILLSTMLGMTYGNIEKAKADGYSETDFCKRQDVVDYCFKSTKDALLASNIITTEYSEELFDLPETPVMHLKGISGEYNHELYLFMDDYSNVAIVQAYLTDTALSAEVRNMIDNLKFSFDGWKNEYDNSNIDVSDNSTGHKSSSGKSRTCPQCNGSGVIKYYYGASDLEAYLDGQEPYTMDTCPTCHGTGKYSGK